MNTAVESLKSGNIMIYNFICIKMNTQSLVSILPWLIPLLIWDATWKGIALWKAGRNKQLAWFICVLLLNTIGILPIIYIVFFQNKKSK